MALWCLRLPICRVSGLWGENGAAPLASGSWLTCAGASEPTCVKEQPWPLGDATAVVGGRGVPAPQPFPGSAPRGHMLCSGALGQGRCCSQLVDTNQGQVILDHIFFKEGPATFYSHIDKAAVLTLKMDKIAHLISSVVCCLFLFFFFFATKWF